MRTIGRPEIVIIAALAEENRVIGIDRDLPWHIPEDLRRFKLLTSGYPLLMGRKTFESILHQFGGPLPNRRNLVLTSRGGLEGYDGVETYGSVREAMQAVADSDRVFIGGGGSIYAQFLEQADRLELTLIDGSYTGDAYFPKYGHLVGTLFEITAIENRDGYRFVTYERFFSGVE
jgi:dihydrofolate reductase